MGTPEKRMITGSGSTGSDLVPTAENRMITGSGSSGSVPVPTQANTMINVNTWSFRSHFSATLVRVWQTTQDQQDHQGTIEQFWQTVQNPLSSDPQGILYEQVGRLFEEDPIQDVRNMDIFDAISNKIRLLEEIPSAFHEQIWGNKEAIAKEPMMRELVKEFIYTILNTSSFCSGLAQCLRTEKTKHNIFKKELRKVAPGSPPLGEAELNSVKEKLKDYLDNAVRDPFEGLQEQFESLLERYEQLGNKLGEKIKELSGKRKASKVWSTVSGSLMAALTAAAAITCVVVVVVAPPTAGAIGTALGLYAASMGFLGEMMLSFRRKEQNQEEAEKLTEKVRRHSDRNELDLNGIRIIMKDANRLRAPIVDYINACSEDHGVLDLADIAMPLIESVEDLVRKLDDLVKKVDGCFTKLTEQIEDLKKPLL